MKLGNNVYLERLARCLPVRFAPFPSACDSMCRAAEQCILLSSVVFSYTCTGLRDGSNSVGWLTETVSLSQHHQNMVWKLETKQTL
jgi:hypothetical protein